MAPLQTLFADLAQRVARDSVRAASAAVKEIKGKNYIYVQEKVGTKSRRRFLGASGDDAAEGAAAKMRAAGERARQRRKLVTLIKNAGVSAS